MLNAHYTTWISRGVTKTDLSAQLVDLDKGYSVSKVLIVRYADYYSNLSVRIDVS